MMNAYDELYVERAQMTLGALLEYAVYALKVRLDIFYQLFLTTDTARRFERGEANCIAGSSGAELALKVMEKAGLAAEPAEPVYQVGRTKEYWTGWTLAYYQWSEAESFLKIEAYLPVKQVFEMYDPYHEMDVRQFVDAGRVLKNKRLSDTALARLRKYAQLSQSMLAKQSGVPVRTIQQYEQRQKDIGKAGAEQILKLSRALGCPVESLLQ